MLERNRRLFGCVSKVEPDAARAHAARLVANGSISEEIQRRIDERAMSANEVLDRLAEQARAAYSAYLTADGVDLQRMIADGNAHLVKGIKETQYGRVIEFHDAQSALVHIGKHHKLFTDRVEQDVTDRAAAALIAAMRQGASESDDE